MEETVKPKAITLTIVLVVVLAELLDPAGQPSSGQQQIPGNRKPACTCYCGGGSPLPFNLFDVAEIKAGKCFGGPLPEDKCGDYFKSLPNEQQKSSCDTIKTEAKSTASCPVLKALAQYCEEKFPPDKKPDKKCEKPTPWFGTSSGCKDVQEPEISINSSGVSLRICGLTLFSNSDNPNYTRSMSDSVYAAALRKLVKSRIGSKLCCDKFWEATRNATGCLPAVDLDCDGIPNKTDTFELNPSMPDLFPDLNTLFSRPEGAPIDPFPEGFDPGDPDFLPPAEKCDCKWELTKGTLTCSPDGKQGHVYQASWRCTSTGNEKFTRKVLPATAPCK